MGNQERKREGKKEKRKSVRTLFSHNSFWLLNRVSRNMGKNIWGKEGGEGVRGVNNLQLFNSSEKFSISLHFLLQERKTRRKMGDDLLPFLFY